MNGNSGKMVAITDREIKRYGSHGIAKVVFGSRNDMLPGMYLVNLAPLLEQHSVQRLWISGKKDNVTFCTSSGKQEAGNGVQKRVEIPFGKAIGPLVEISYMAKHSGDDSGFDIRARYTSGEAVTSVRMPTEAAVAAGI